MKLKTPTEVLLWDTVKHLGRAIERHYGRLSNANEYVNQLSDDAAEYIILEYRNSVDPEGQKEAFVPGSYVVHYRGLKGERMCVYLPEGKGLGDVSEGFWLNSDSAYTQASDAQRWIPPSRLLSVVKRVRTGEGEG